ncbi:hypothetical protein V2J09_006157 [Rumex salicifolius]
MEGEELTEQETALYDRQIRVWGADAQRRLSKSHVLVSGMKGTIAEFCKNIVLAGVGSLTLVDDKPVNEDASSANFLIPPEENAWAGRSVAEVCCESLMEFNPMVRVLVEKGDIASFDSDFFEKFDVVVVSCCSLKAKVWMLLSLIFASLDCLILFVFILYLSQFLEKKDFQFVFPPQRLINEKCRKSSKRIAFYSVECRDSCGEIFVDLQKHTCSKKKLDGTIELQIEYPNFEEAIAVRWRNLPKRVSKLYFAMRVIERFEESQGCNYGETSLSDLPNALKTRKDLCEANSFSETQIPDSLLGRLLEGRREFPPVCAILGGILGQEVIKAISGKGETLKNFFFYDAMDGKGIIENIS